MPIEVTVEQAFGNIDQALANAHATRQAHEILKASIERIRNEISQLQKELHELRTQ
jgi:formate-dependent nitrite reductase cytochrome c552 subunit